MSSKSSHSPDWLIPVAATVGVLLAVRTIKRQLSPTIRSKLSCNCGKIQGEVCAKREDSIRINCYCQDCRDYAQFIAQLGGHEDTTIGKPCGDNRLVQVCKSALTIHQGRELLKLAIKFPKNKDGKQQKQKEKQQLYMHRFYAGCCHVPLFNTVDFLGFVGVFRDFLDSNQEQFAGPVRMFPEEALVEPSDLPKEPDIFVPDFLWKVVRYLPWAQAGPFEYNLEPVYWGKAKKDN